VRMVEEVRPLLEPIAATAAQSPAGGG
jgi:hypothetical protein